MNVIIFCDTSHIELDYVCEFILVLLPQRALISSSSEAIILAAQ